MKTVAEILEQESRQFANIDCIDVLKKFGIKMYPKQNGAIVMCPIHGDKNTPSMRIYQESNTWTCFSAKCHNPIKPGKRNGGSVFDLVMQIQKCDFISANNWLRKNFNITKKTSVKIKTIPKKEYSNKIDEVNYYHSLLKKQNKQEYFIKRGFTQATIDKQKFGYSGDGFIIPIWEGEPSNSSVLSIKKRRVNYSNGPKYIRIGSNDTLLYLVHYCKNQKTINAFAGEIDCALANQYNIPSFSLIDGAGGWTKLSKNWPNLYFPNSENLNVIFDKKEEIMAAQMAKMWEDTKGKFTSKIIHYPDFNGNDFNDFILDKGVESFYKLINFSEWY